MKVKELDVTANFSWSPQSDSVVRLATGTAAQQLDATFSTSSTLEIHKLDLGESGHQMPKVASLNVDSRSEVNLLLPHVTVISKLDRLFRYHKLVWEDNVIVGGLDRGIIAMYDAQKIISGQESPMTFSKDKHTGPVQALDFNPFQKNLLASGGSESEIFIWDLNKLSSPMTPGAKSQPHDDVRAVAWNRQVLYKKRVA